MEEAFVSVVATGSQRHLLASNEVDKQLVSLIGKVLKQLVVLSLLIGVSYHGLGLLHVLLRKPVVLVLTQEVRPPRVSSPPLVEGRLHVCFHVGPSVDADVQLVARQLPEPGK